MAEFTSEAWPDVLLLDSARQGDQPGPGLRDSLPTRIWTARLVARPEGLACHHAHIAHTHRPACCTTTLARSHGTLDEDEATGELTHEMTAVVVYKIHRESLAQSCRAGAHACAHMRTRSDPPARRPTLPC